MRSRCVPSACSTIVVAFVILAGVGANAHPTPPGTVTGTLFGAGDLPLEHATVYLLAGSTLVGSVSTDSAGVFEFTDRSPGDYVLVAEAWEHQPLAVNVLLPEGQAWARDLFLVPGVGEPYVEGPNEWFGFIACGAVGIALCQFDPNDERRLHLTVARGIRTIQTTLEWEATNPTAEVLALELRDGANTIARVEGLSPLELRVDIDDRDDAAWLLEFRVVLPVGVHVFHQQRFAMEYSLHYWTPAPHHEMQDAGLRADAAGAVTGAVFSEELEPIPGATLYLLGDGSLHGVTHTAENGQYTFNEVVPRGYTLAAAAAGHRPAAAGILVSADTTTTRFFLLETIVPTPEPYVWHHEAAGFVACDVGSPLWIKCGPADPNHHPRVDMGVDAGVRTIDLQVDWVPSAAFGLDGGSLSIEVQLLAAGAGLVVLAHETGPPPLVFRFTDAEFGFAQYDESDVVLSISAAAPFGTVVYQQAFEVAATIHHWAPAP